MYFFSYQFIVLLAEQDLAPCIVKMRVARGLQSLISHLFCINQTILAWSAAKIAVFGEVEREKLCGESKNDTLDYVV